MAIHISAEQYLAGQIARSGRAVLPAPTIDEAVDGVISSDALQRGLTLRVPNTDLPNKTAYLSAYGYVFMSFYNVENQGGYFPPIHMPAEDALQLEGQKIELKYAFTDDLISEANYYDFAIKLHEVHVQSADDYVIPWCAAAAGVEVVVPPYHEMKEKDIVSLYWIGERGVGGLVRHIEVESHDVGQPLGIFIGAEVTCLAGNTNVHIWYTVSHGDSERKGPLATYAVRGQITMDVERSSANELLSGEFMVFANPKQFLKMPPPLEIAQGDQQSVLVLPRIRNRVDFEYKISGISITVGYRLNSSGPWRKSMRGCLFIAFPNWRTGR
jgi:hypothetical protein